VQQDHLAKGHHWSVRKLNGTLLIPRLLFINGKVEDFKAVQEYLRTIGIEMTVHDISKMLKQMRFKEKKKVNTNFVSNKNKAIRLLWCRNHQHFTVDQC
jgi:glutaminase